MIGMIGPVDFIGEHDRKARLLLGLTDLETIVEKERVPAEKVVKELKALIKNKSPYQALSFSTGGFFCSKSRRLYLHVPFTYAGFRLDSKDNLEVRYFREYKIDSSIKAVIKPLFILGYSSMRNPTSEVDNHITLITGFRKGLVISPEIDLRTQTKKLDEALSKLSEDEFEKEYKGLDQFSQMEKIGIPLYYLPPSATGYKIGLK